MFNNLKIQNTMKADIEKLKGERSANYKQRDKLQEELADQEFRLQNGMISSQIKVSELKIQIAKTRKRDSEIDQELAQSQHYLQNPELLAHPNECAAKIETALSEIEKAGKELDKVLSQVSQPLERYTKAFDKLYTLSRILPSGIAEARMAELKVTSALVHHLGGISTALSLPARYDIEPLSKGLTPMLESFRKYASNLRKKS
jgi:chromosome segregation ATPase